MAYKLTWLPDVLLAAGLKVSQVAGWETRGRREMGTVVGVMCHHTAGPIASKGTMASLNVLINGRTGLPGPLAQLGLGRDGTFYVIAAGVANHAGLGKWQGQVDTGPGEVEGDGRPQPSPTTGDQRRLADQPSPILQKSHGSRLSIAGARALGILSMPWCWIEASHGPVPSCHRVVSGGPLPCRASRPVSDTGVQPDIRRREPSTWVE